MANRTVVNGTDADVTVASLVCEKRSVKVIDILTDANLASWVGTAGIAVLAAGASTDYQTRRNIARRLKYNIPGELIG